MLIKCPECNHEISDKAKICPYCGVEFTLPQKKGQGYYCPRCLTTYYYDDYLLFESKGFCAICKAGGVEIKLKESIIDTWLNCRLFPDNHPELKNSPEFSEEAYNKRKQGYRGDSTVLIKCPNCKGYNTSKISTVERGISVGFWGLFSNKIGKTYKCNSCGHTW